MDARLIDWNDVWKDQMTNWRKSNFGRTCGEYWKDDDAARKYWLAKMSQRDEQIEERIDEMAVGPRSRILDIGSGPGVLAIPMAERAAHVTAVEPTQGMVNVMREIVTRRGIANLDWVQKKWDDVDVRADLEPPYDVVLASKSLGMFDIREAVRKMEAVCSGQVHLYWFAGQPTWDHLYNRLWPELHQMEYQTNPKCDVLFNVLYSMGVYPHINTYPSEFVETFSSLRESVDYFAPKFNAETAGQKSTLRAGLEQFLENDNGSYAMRYKTTCMHIWWDKRPSV